MRKLFIATLLLLVSTQLFATQAPNFTLKKANGESVSLNQFKGKPVIIHFWATWCPYCKKLQPSLNKLYQQYHDKGLEILAVSIWEEDDAKPQQEMNQRGYPFITLLHGEKVAEQYQVSGTPTTVFISRTGEIIWRTSESNPNNPNLLKATQTIVNGK